MKPLLACLAGILIFFAPLAGNAQPQQPVPAPTASSDTTTKSSVAGSSSAIEQPDDEFNLFLFAYLIAFCSVVVVAVIVGSVAVIMILLALFALVSAGIVSAGVLVGIYKRSVAAGFRALLVIVCSLGGIVAGAGGLWLIDRLFPIHLGGRAAALLGAAGGLVGGLLMGIVVFQIIRPFIRYFRQKLSLPPQP
jgi:hypothetical protein